LPSFLQHDIHVTAYSPLGNTNPLYAKDDKLTPIVQHPVIQHLAAKHGCTPANILISLQIKVRRRGRHTLPMNPPLKPRRAKPQQGHSVVPKSVTPSRILENMKVVELTDEDVEAISGIKERKRYADFSDIIGYRYYSDLDDTV
jgi:alcohol dehydrogenase (NADP+)